MSGPELTTVIIAAIVAATIAVTHIADAVKVVKLTKAGFVQQKDGSVTRL